MKDNVNHPSHYTQGGIECIDALEAATEGLRGWEAVLTANAIKYLWRWKQKNGIEDLKKAVWYTERLIKKLSEKEDKKDGTRKKKAKVYKRSNSGSYPQHNGYCEKAPVRRKEGE